MPEPTTCAARACRDYPTELDDVLGHDQVGHLARNLLCRSGISTVPELREMTDVQLLSIDKFGQCCLARVREKVPAPQSRSRAWASAPS